MRFHEPHDRGLARGVGADVRHRVRRAAAAEDDDFSAAGRLERRHERAARQQHAVKVNLDCAHPLAEVDAFRRPHRAIDAGVVDENVDRPEFVLGERDERLHLRLVRHIARVAEHALAGRDG